MGQILNITVAKQKLLELARRNKELGECFILIKNGEPISALLPFEEYESLLETLDILEEEPNILALLKKAETDIKDHKFKVWPGSKKRTMKRRK